MIDPSAPYETPSDARRFAGAALMLAGDVGLYTGLLYLGLSAATGARGLPSAHRLMIAAAVGYILKVIGYRVGSGQWAGVSQEPQHDAALAGVLFLAAVAGSRLGSRHPIVLTGRVALVSACAVALIASWYWRARHRRVHRGKP